MRFVWIHFIGDKNVHRITHPTNERTRRLLSRLGMHEQGLRTWREFGDPLAYFAIDHRSAST